MKLTPPLRQLGPSILFKEKESKRRDREQKGTSSPG